MAGYELKFDGDCMNEQPQDLHERPAFRKRCYRVLRRCLRSCLAFTAFYILCVLAGLIPVNNNFKPTPDGIEVFLTSTAVHADIILPIDTDTIDWREHFLADSFSGDTITATHVAIGWGDKGFFVDTPTWRHLRAGTVVNALFFPSDSCMHVTMARIERLPSSVKSVKLSVAEYERLVKFINASFRHDSDGWKIPIRKAAYGYSDAFFEAHGTYHGFNTCNCWVGKSMQSAGIRTGWFTPLPGSMLLYID